MTVCPRARGEALAYAHMSSDPLPAQQPPFLFKKEVHTGGGAVLFAR